MPTDEDRCVRCTHLRRVHTAHGGCAACEDAIGCPGFAEQHREGVHYCLGCGHRAISHRMLTGGGGCQVRDCPCQLSRNYVDMHQPTTQQPEEIDPSEIRRGDIIEFTYAAEGMAEVTLKGTAHGVDHTDEGRSWISLESTMNWFPLNATVKRYAK